MSARGGVAMDKYAAALNHRRRWSLLSRCLVRAAPGLIFDGLELRMRVHPYAQLAHVGRRVQHDFNIFCLGVSRAMHS